MPKFYKQFLYFSLEDSDDGLLTNGDIDEESLIKYFFRCGFPYKEIISRLKRFDIIPSKSTLIRRLKSYRLSKRGTIIDQASFENVTKRI